MALNEKRQFVHIAVYFGRVFVLKGSLPYTGCLYWFGCSFCTQPFPLSPVFGSCRQEVGTGMKIAVPCPKHGKSSSAQNTMLVGSTCKCSFLYDLLVFQKRRYLYDSVHFNLADLVCYSHFIIVAVAYDAIEYCSSVIIIWQ